MIAEYTKIIDDSIAFMARHGYRVAHCNFVDSARRVCCPMGAVDMAGNSYKIPNDFKIRFVDGFDGVNRRTPTEAEELGRKYRMKVLKFGS